MNSRIRRGHQGVTLAPSSFPPHPYEGYWRVHKPCEIRWLVNPYIPLQNYTPVWIHTLVPFIQQHYHPSPCFPWILRVAFKSGWKTQIISIINMLCLLKVIERIIDWNWNKLHKFILCNYLPSYFNDYQFWNIHWTCSPTSSYNFINIIHKFYAAQAKRVSPAKPFHWNIYLHSIS